MKFPILLFISLSILFSSCVSFLPYANSSLEIPLRPGETVEVFYPGELLPYKKYIEVGPIAIREGLSRNETLYVNRLKMLAQKTGLDALINVKREFDENALVEEPSYLYTATGIKYIKNIDYLDEYVREESFYTVEEDSGKKILSAVIERTPAGQIVSSKFLNDEAHSSYKVYIQDFRDYHLLEEQENWSYHMGEYEQTPLYRRFSRVGGWKVKTCRFLYEENNRVRQIRINFHDRDADTKVFYTYNDLGQIIKRKLSLTHNREVLEEYTYDDSGRVIQKEYKIRNSGVGVFHTYVSTYSYYKKEDIHSFIY